MATQSMGNKLVVKGTSGNDDITIRVSPVNSSYLEVTVSGQDEFVGLSASLGSIEVQTYGGRNTVNVESTPAGVSLAIDTGGIISYKDALNTINLGHNGSTRGIQGSVRISNPLNPTNIIIDDSGDRGDPTVTLSSFYGEGAARGIVTGLTPPNTRISYDLTEYATLDIHSGIGGSTFNIQGGTPAGGTGITGGSGIDTINVQAASGPLYIEGGGGMDSVTIGSKAPLLGGTLQYISAGIFVSNSAGTTYLYVDDRGNGNPRTFTLGDTPDYSYVTWGSSGGVSWVPPATSLYGVKYVSILGGGGGNTFNVLQTSNYGLDGWTWLDTGSKNDFVNVRATQSPLFIHNSGGNDTTRIGSLTSSTVGDLERIQGEVTVNGEGATALTLDARGDVNYPAATLTYLAPYYQVKGLSPAAINYANNGGKGVTSLAVMAGPRTHAYNVQTTANGVSTFLYLGNSTNDINVGNAANKLDDIQGILAIYGGTGTDKVFVNDQGQPTSAKHNYTLTNTKLTRDGMAAINYNYGWYIPPGPPPVVDQLTLNGGPGGNTYYVQSTARGIPTTLNAGAGLDTISVGSTANTLDGIQGTLTINSQGGQDQIIFNDQGQTAGRTYSITNTQLIWADMADIYYDPAGAPPAPAPAGVTLKAGAGADTFALVNRSRVPLTINGGGGQNTLDYSTWATGVTVNLTTGQATGLASMSGIWNVTGGAGDDILVGDANPNILIGGGGRNLIIGGAGQDQLKGGPDGDILIGGSTTWDQNAVALAAILTEWKQPGVKYEDRIDHLRNGTGVNGSYVLNSTTVLDDSAIDTLAAGDGLTWFWANVTGPAGSLDVLTNKKPNEQVN